MSRSMHSSTVYFASPMAVRHELEDVVLVDVRGSGRDRGKTRSRPTSGRSLASDSGCQERLERLGLDCRGECGIGHPRAQLPEGK